jgi:hypothetical protein
MAHPLHYLRDSPPSSLSCQVHSSQPLATRPSGPTRRISCPPARKRSPMGTSAAPRAHGTCPRIARSHRTTPICPTTSHPVLHLARRISRRRVQDQLRPRSSPPSRPDNLSVVAFFAPVGRVSAHTRARAHRAHAYKQEASAFASRTAVSEQTCMRGTIADTRRRTTSATSATTVILATRHRAARSGARTGSGRRAHTLDHARLLVRGEERQHRTATRKPGPPFYFGADMRAALDERLSRPRATIPSTRSPRRFTRPRRRRSRPRSSASLSGPGALRRLIILNLDGSFCTPPRCAPSRSRLAPRFSG